MELNVVTRALVDVLVWGLNNSDCGGKLEGKVLISDNDFVDHFGLVENESLFGNNGSQVACLGRCLPENGD